MVMDDEKHEMWIVCYIVLGIVRYFSRIASREKEKELETLLFLLFLKSLKKMNSLLLLLVLICLVSVSGQFGVGRKKDKVSF